MIRKTTRIKKKLQLLMGVVFALTSTLTQAQTVLINPAAEGGFESGTTYTANGWSVVNYAAATRNNWVLGTAAPTGYSGSRAGYISNNSAATPPPYAYDNATSATVHLYRDVVFPAGETLINFSFSEIQTGETGWDRMLVFISNAAPTGTPATGTPSSNTATLTGYTLLATTSAYSAWTTVNVPITAAQAGNATAASSRRILFVWQNDGSDGTGSVGLDNISLTTSCLTPLTGQALTAVGTTTATFSWGAVTGATGYNVRYKLVTDPVTVGTWATPATTATTSLPVTGLVAGSRYEFQVAAIGTGICNAFSGSTNFFTACAGPTVTSSTPASRCGTGTVSLQAAVSTGASLSWYDTPVGGSPIGNISPFTTPVISATTNFYAAATTIGSTSVTRTLGGGSLTTSASGTSSVNYASPFSHYYGGYKAQYVLRAADLVAAGVVAGNLTSLAFDVTTAGTSYAGFNISIANTTSTVATGASFATAGFTSVYTGAPTATVGINTFTFSTPFYWNGSSNIIVALCWSNNNGGGTAAEVKYDETSYTAMAFYRSDNESIATVCGATTPSGTLSMRPKMIFGNAAACEGPRVVVAANVTTAPAITVSSPQSPGICTGGTATISVTSPNTNYAYSWSSGQTTASFTVTPTAGTTYTVVATDPGTNCVRTDSVRINVNTVPAVPVLTPATGTICLGSSLLLSASSGSAATATFGTGTNVNSSTGYPSPYSNYYGGVKHQMMIRASELTTAGFVAGAQITSIGFRISSVGSTFTGTLQNFQINMGGTTATTLGGTSFEAVPTIVYGPLAQAIPTTGAFPLTVTHTLATPFTWNGTDNVVIQTSYSNLNTGASTDAVFMLNTNPGFSSTNWYPEDGATAATIRNATIPGGSGNERPNIILGYGVRNPISWAPVTGLYRNAGLTVAIGANDTASSVYASPAATTTYTAVANQQGCRSAVSNNSVVTVNPVPSAAISYTGPVSFCQGANLALSTPTGTGLTYVWRRDGNPIVGATSATYTADSTGAYTVTVTNSSTCSTTTATPVNITVVPAPAATITASGTTSFCVGGSVVLSAPVAPAGVTYTYVWRDNNVAVAGQTAQTFTVNSSRNVTVTVTNTTTSCSATTPVATVVTVGPPPPAPISSALTPAVVCAGQSVRLRTNNAGGLSYQWKLGGVDVAGAIDSFLDATAAGNYTVVVSAGGATCASTSAALAVTVNALPNAAITASGAPTVFCLGGSVVLTANTGSNLAYQWQLGSGPTTPPDTASTHTATASGNYRVIVTNRLTSCFSASNTIAVTVRPLPVATVTAASAVSICAGNTVVLNANTGTGRTYQWLNGAAAIPGATNASYTASTGGAYTVRVTDTNSCSNTSAATTVTVNPLPPTGISPSGAVNICSGSSVTLVGPSATGLTFQWRNGNTNATGTSTTGSYTATAAGTYRLVVTSSAGCRDTSVAATVTVQPLPAVAMAPATATSGCDSVVLSTANTGVTYQWNYNNAPIVGATNATYAATVSGNYSLTNTSTGNSCPATSANVAITVNQAPLANITYSSPIVFCEGGAVVLNTYTGTNQTYEWRNNNVIIPGATTPEYITSQSGIYSVKVVNTVTGCTRISAQPIIVRVNPIPTPAITYNAVANVLSTTQPFSLYQWNYNMQPIAGATQRNYSPQQNGAYAVSVIDSNGCTNISEITFINSVGVANTAAGKGIRIYPNPTNGMLYVSASMNVNLVLRDVTGKAVRKSEGIARLDLENLADGLYLLYISDATGQLIRAEKITKASH